MTTFWPGTKTPKSIFYNPKRPPPLPTTRFGKAPTGITIGKSSKKTKAGI